MPVILEQEHEANISNQSVKSSDVSVNTSGIDKNELLFDKVNPKEDGEPYEFNSTGRRDSPRQSIPIRPENSMSPLLPNSLNLY